MPPTPRLDALVNSIKVEFPDFRIISKVDSTLMRAIHRSLMIVTFGGMRGFMTGYTTTLGTTMYVPVGWTLLSEHARLSILRHERVHMRQARTLGLVLYAFLYLFVFLPMVLSYFRARFEMNAYAETLAADHEYGVDILGSRYKEGIIDQFVGPAYGWMWPFRGYVEKWYVETATRIINESSN